MKGLFKKISACVIVLGLAASMSAGAFAQTEMTNMKFGGYDTTDPDNPNKIYNEVIDGKYTNKQVLVPVTPEWRIDGYDTAGGYPYAGYSRMYLEGNRQDITCYNGLFPQWETRRQDYMWEIKSPHFIWERHQTKVNGKAWSWDYGNALFKIPDSDLLTKTIRKATVVKIEYKPYGFGPYNNNGKPLTADERRMYSDFGVTAISKWEDLLKNQLSVASLSARDLGTNLYTMTDETIAALIPVVSSKYITAKFNTQNNDGLSTKNVAAEYLAHMNDGWEWDSDSFASGTATVSWTAPAYEFDEPYKAYQLLIVNGIVLDGTNGKDYVFRYTGGLGHPEITWKFKGFEENYDDLGDVIYQVIEEKYVDGRASGITRKPTGKYGYSYFKINGNNIEYWIVDDAKNAVLAETFENWTGSLGGLIQAFKSGSIYYDTEKLFADGVLPEEKYKKLP